MKFSHKTVRIGLVGLLGATIVGFLTLAGLYIYIAPTLPSIEVLRDIRLQVPLRVYTADQKLIAEFGEKKRSPIHFRETPPLMIKAILAAEDDRFFEHPGVDYQGILRAGVNLIRTGEKSQGGSTITMQVARNFFLSSEKTYLRKVSEIFLALKMERELDKEAILELYLNKIYLGNRAYGIVSAAHTYYGARVDQLTIPQMAMIAGLPKAPSRYNPIINPERAVIRRDYVLRRMHELGFIDDTQFQQALATADDARLRGLAIDVEANYLAEMVRADMLREHGEEAYTAGYKVYTSIDSRLQVSAVHALRNALLDYDRRHGYRGTQRHVDFDRLQEPQDWQEVLSGLDEIGGLQTALVLSTEDQSAAVMLPNQQIVAIPWSGLSWARHYIDDNTRGPAPQSAADILQAGDIIRIERRRNGEWWLAQVPEVSGALVAIRPDDGRIVALVGGFDFFHSKFNRVTQATRQPGSAFKPFIYSAALEKGYTPASLVNDAPVVFEDPGLESTWRPENYSGKFFGPTRLRVALTKSRNLVSIRLLRSIGIDYTLDYVGRFGFEREALPHNLSLALGSGAITPLSLASGYTVFANGGFRVTPHFIRRILNTDDEVIFQANPETVCTDCETPPDRREDIMAAPSADQGGEPGIPVPILARRVVPAENVYLMTSMMQDVIRQGTGRRATQLGRHDIAGKTGTTNDQRDAWFSGFNSDLVAITWVGFDKSRSLGNGETGGRAALPMWIEFMADALKGTPEKQLTRPPGLVTVRIDPETGLLAPASSPNAIFETFRLGSVPKQQIENAPTAGGGSSAKPQNHVPEQLF